MVKIKRTIAGFKRSEKISVSAETYFEAFYELGKKVSGHINKQYNELVKGVDEVKVKEYIAKAQERLNFMEHLSNTGAVKVEGINYLQRYLHAFYGTSQGAGLSYGQGMMMQMEGELGCQTMMVQDRRNGVVRMVHAEEDASFSRNKDMYRYKWVKMTVGSNMVRFFYYPELFGWGPAIGVNETTGMVVTIDDLIPRKKYENGNFCIMAVAFMILDCGESKLVDQLVGRLRQVDGLLLDGGYAIHIAQATDEGGEMRSVEAMYDKIEFVEHDIVDNRRILAQSNCPIMPELKPMAQAIPPESGRWRFSNARLYVEMKERRERLLKQAEAVPWLNKGPKETLQEGERMLANPEGDTMEFIDKEGKLNKYYTGLASRWVLAHLAVYAGKGKLYYHIGKFLPKPIKGQEYSIRVVKNYPYSGQNLSDMAREEITKYYARRKEERKKKVI